MRAEILTEIHIRYVGIVLHAFRFFTTCCARVTCKIYLLSSDKQNRCDEQSEIVDQNGF